MRNCIFCGKPCKSGICDECSEEYENIDEVVINKFLHAIASREACVHRPKEEEDQDALQ